MPLSSQSTNHAPTPERSKLMSGVRQTGTSVEILVQTLLRGEGIQFSTRGKGLPGTPDIYNRSDKWAIFVHGCFWHRHLKCKKSKIPSSNKDFWKKKFRDNRRRDKRKAAELRAQGYVILCIWGCELSNPESLRNRLKTFVAATALPRESFEILKKSNKRTIELPKGSVTQLVPRYAHDPSKDAASAFDYSVLRSKESSVVPSAPAVRVADLFSGCGGFSLGASEACRALGKRFESVLALDSNQASLNVYKKNFEPVEASSLDITAVLNGELGRLPSICESALAKKLGKIDLLLAGPPCQGHSDLNNHTRRDDERNRLYERVARFVEIAKPRHVLIENVAGVIHAKNRCVDRSIAALKAAGYHVSTGLVDLATIGVPQRRKRHLLVGSLDAALKIEDVVSKHSVEIPRTVRWAIGDLETENNKGIFYEQATLSEDNVKRIKYLRRHHLFDLPNSQRPKCHKNGDHSYRSMYGRLKYSKPAQTITSGFGSPGQGRYIHPTRPRTLTAHEAARIQFFPDYFDFSSVKNYTELRQMIGNAVPMKLSYIFMLELLGRAAPVIAKRAEAAAAPESAPQLVASH